MFRRRRRRMVRTVAIIVGPEYDEDVFEKR